MNRTLTSGVGVALAMIIFSCSENSVTGADGLNADDLNADAARIATVTVSLRSSTVAVGDTTRATASLVDYQNRPLIRTVTWTSSDSAIATVSSSGLVTGIGEGTALITATRGLKSGSATVTVTPSVGGTSVAPVDSVRVTLAATSLNPGQTTQATATTYDSADNVLTGRTISWSSSNTAVATVSGSGLVTAVALGTSQISATSEGKSGSAALTVATAPPPTGNPGTVTDLRVTATDSTSVTLAFTQVNDGTGQPARYDVRYAAAPISWGSATTVTSGSCAAPVIGTAIGSALTCKVAALKPSTSYGFQLVAFRGTLNGGAVFGPLSNAASATTSASGSPPPPPPPPPTGSPEPVSGDVILWQDNFNKSTLTDLVGAYATRGTMQLITTGHSGSAIRFPYTSGSWDNLIEKTFPVSTDTYFRYWYRLSPGADPTCGNRNPSGFKWFMPWRITTSLRYTMGVGNLPGGPSGFTNSGLEFSSHDNTSSGEPNPFMQNISKAKTFKTTADGAWHEYTLHVVTGNGGYEQIWIDGLLVLDNSAYHYDHDPNGIGLIQFPGTLVQWFSGCEFTVDVDDFVIWHK
jgi:hypothetical protein